MFQLPKLPSIRKYVLRFRASGIQVFSLITFVLLLFVTLFFSTKLVHAQIPAPTVPCGDFRDEEFHSLRPYQASPCSDDLEPSALFCGNDLVLTDPIRVRRSDNVICYTLPPDEEECFFSVDRSLNLAIDVSGADLPIMGRTEDDVVNSQIQPNPEGTDDAEKVNDYVSWYLNGINGRAEYNPPNPDTDEGSKRIIDFSGPIKKLLSWENQVEKRRNEVRDVRDNRHDQIIGCRQGENPVSCYLTGGTTVRLSYWVGRFPPLSSAYATLSSYLTALRIWRILVFEKLFSYIPFSSTEDRLGQIQVVNPIIQPVQPDVTISNVVINTSPADLFFSHMEESRELADVLQDTYVPQDNPRSGPVSGVSPSPYCDLTQIRTNPGDDLFAGEIGVDLSYTAEFSCIFDLFDPDPPIDTFWCDNVYGGRCFTSDWDCDNWGSNTTLFCPVGYRCGYPPSSCSPDQPNPSCQREAQVVLNTITKTPLVDEIWSRLVAGSSAVFKRIFPKVEPGAPVEGILDIPAATGVTYSLSGAPAGVTLTAGNPGNRRGQAAELYFPHIGGIQQYFLQCIQTALRPQGYGQICPSGEPAETSGTCPSVPDSAIPGEWLGGFKQNFIDLVNRWDPSCPGPENNLADECYNYVVSESLGEGVNPAFSLTIWANETAASNYCSSGPNAQDFGINDPSIEQNIVAQLERFLFLPYSGTYTFCRNQPGWIEPMHAFLSVFRAGGCDPNDPSGTGYYNDIRTFTWPLVTGDCITGGLFSINWPTDQSCP